MRFQLNITWAILSGLKEGIVDGGDWLTLWVGPTFGETCGTALPRSCIGYMTNWLGELECLNLNARGDRFGYLCFGTKRPQSILFAGSSQS